MANYGHAALSGLMKAAEAVPKLGLPETRMSHPIAREMDQRVKSAMHDRTYMPRAAQEATKAVRADPKTAFVEDAVAMLTPLPGGPTLGVASKAGKAAPGLRSVLGNRLYRNPKGYVAAAENKGKAIQDSNLQLGREMFWSGVPLPRSMTSKKVAEYGRERSKAEAAQDIADARMKQIEGRFLRRERSKGATNSELAEKTGALRRLGDSAVDDQMGRAVPESKLTLSELALRKSRQLSAQPRLLSSGQRWAEAWNQHNERDGKDGN